MQALERFLTGSAARDALITTDLKGRILLWSRGADLLLGYSEGEVVGRELDALLPPKHRELEELNRAEAAAGNSVRNVLVKMLHESGSVVRCLQSMMPVSDGSGQPVAVLRILFDLSAVREAEQSLRMAHARLAGLRTEDRAPAAVGPARAVRGERARMCQEYLRVLEADLGRVETLLEELRSDIRSQSTLLVGAREDGPAAS